MKREFYFLFALVLVLTAAVAFLAGYVLFGDRGGRTPPHGFPSGAELEGAPELPPAGLRLAEGWKCMCGTCTDDLLDCHCEDANGAHEIKGLVRDSLNAGLSEEAVREKLVKRYGPRLLGDQELITPGSAPNEKTTGAEAAPGTEVAGE